MNESCKPQEWQIDPQYLTAKQIKHWRWGMIVSYTISLEKARQMVRQGKVFVMNDESIGTLSADGTIEN